MKRLMVELWKTAYARAAVVLLILYLSVAIPPLFPLRWVAGLILVVFLPGYVWTSVLFPHREWDRLLYFTLSIGLSLAGDVLCGLLLNFTPWCLTPATWTVALSILVLFGAVVDAAIRIRALPDWQS